MADRVPSIGQLLDDPKTGAGLQTALKRYQKYVSHSDLHGMDLYESLQAMAQPSRPDGKGGFVPNPDAKYADQLVQAFGGTDVLKAYHDEVAPLEIKNEGQANDMLASNAPNSRAYKYAHRWLNAQTQQKADEAAAEEKARAAANPQNNDVILTTPDALGFTPRVPGGLKEYNKRQNAFKKNVDDLSKTEGTYQQFQSILNDINSGRDMTGAQSVVGLFNAIGISATPLKGAGFRINNNTIEEHAEARGLGQSLYQKLLGLKAGDVITPQQLKDYATIAAQARQSQYVNLVNQVHNAGLNADFVLPTGNGERIDPATARIFLQIAGGNKDRARQAATQKGWIF